MGRRFSLPCIDSRGCRLGFVVPVVADIMVPVSDSDVGIGTVRTFVGKHQRDNSRLIHLKSQHGEIAEQCDALSVIRWLSRRRRHRKFGAGRLLRISARHHRDAAFDRANSIEILVEFAPIVRAQFRVERWQSDRSSHPECSSEFANGVRVRQEIHQWVRAKRVVRRRAEDHPPSHWANAPAPGDIGAVCAAVESQLPAGPFGLATEFETFHPSRSCELRGSDLINADSRRNIPARCLQRMRS